MRSLARLRGLAATTAAATALALGVVAAPAAVGSDSVPLNEAHVGATNPGFGTSTCPTPPEGQEGWWGWHFIMPKNHNFTSLSVTFETAGTFTADPFPGTVFVAHPDESHAYIWTPTADTLESGWATSSGTNAFFNLSHVCPGGGDEPGDLPLEVTKTADTTYDREHFWDIAKKVETENEYTHDGYPKVWLYTDGSGDEKATWTVDVEYKGYEDSGWNVSGTVTIKNLNKYPVDVVSISDLFNGDASTPVDLLCPWSGLEPELPYQIPAEGEVQCSYSEDGDVEGYNQVTVGWDGETSEGESVAYADIVWGDPASEKDETVNVEDISDLFGPVDLGSVTAPNGDSFTYDKNFSWADYGQAMCGDHVYDNEATLYGDEDAVLGSAEATLKVNVQCFLYETAFAKASNGTCFIDDGFDRWGWTNPVAFTRTNGTWDLWAAAGQCDTSKGTKVGTVNVTTLDGVVDVKYNVDSGYMLDETHVYAGATKYPMVKKGKKWVGTVAPGQYTVSNLAGAGWVIAHAVVGIPDPDFGPTP